jgi:DNA-binding MarR family transcriptional regulator
VNDKKNNSHQKPLYIDRKLIKSKAFFDLNATSIKVLLIFFSKRQMTHIGRGKKKRWVCTNNGNIYFTYREAKEQYEITYPAFSRAIDELVANGFIDITRPGIGKKRVSTLYAISERWKDYDKEDFVKIERVKRVSYTFKKKEQT